MGRWRDRLGGWLVGFVVLVALNVLFHQFLAASFFYGSLRGIVVPAAAVKSRFVLADYALLAAATLYLTGKGPAVRAAITGGILGTVSFGTWNLVNYAFVPGWPAALAVVDSGWHVAAGALAGLVMGVFLRWRATSVAR